MFIGREKELTLLQQDYIGKAVMVYGKRRVGKTTLIQKALENGVTKGASTASDEESSVSEHNLLLPRHF